MSQPQPDRGCSRQSCAVAALAASPVAQSTCALSHNRNACAACLKLPARWWRGFIKKPLTPVLGISVIKTFGTPCATASLPPTGSRISGATEDKSIEFRGQEAVGLADLGESAFDHIRYIVG